MSADLDLIDRARSGDGDAFRELITPYESELRLEYQGRDLIGRFLRQVAFRDGRNYRLVPTRANGQLAFHSYLPDADNPNDLLVLTLEGPAISAMTRFRPLGVPSGV